MVAIMSPMPRSAGSVPTAATKPLPQRPTLSRKRDDSDDTYPSSSAKRAKVTFDPDVEVRVMGDWEKAPELVQEEVRRALEKHAMGDNSSYNQVKGIYTTKEDIEDEPSSTTIKNYTKALIGSASSLNKSCSDLVYAVVGSHWLGRDGDYVDLHVRLLAHLVTAHGEFLADVLRMLVENLTTSKRLHCSKILTAKLKQNTAPPSNGKLPNMPIVARSQIHLRTHRALQHLLQLIPSASQILSSIFTSSFPHQTGSKRAHSVFVENLLKLTSYAPQLQTEVLALITERLVKIDVQVQVDLEDLAEDFDDGLVQGIPRLGGDEEDEMDDSDSSDDESETADETEDAEAHRTKDMTRNVEKMDIILDLLFGYYDHMFSSSAVEDRVRAFSILQSHFDTILLPTHRSRHTQFLLFHFSQTSPTFIDTFVSHCAGVTLDRNQPAMVRQGAAAYLASFVARGIHVPTSDVRMVFGYVGRELDRLQAEYEPNCRGPDLRRYSTYYILVQALLYIFCFRWRDLEISPEEDFEDDDLPAPYGEERQWIPGVKETFDRHIRSKLNPLKVCSPVIVTEFARVAYRLGVVYVYSILETNKRIRLSQFASLPGMDFGQPNRETALSARKDESHQHLDEYFPFDPYHLPRSKRWVEGDYREWTDITGLNDDNAAESESDEEDSGDSEVEEGTETDDTASSI